MEKIIQEGNEMGLEKDVAVNLQPKQPVNAEEYKVNTEFTPTEGDKEKINALREELEQIGKQENVPASPYVHVGDNNAHINNSMNISNTINNNAGSNSEGRSKEAPVQQKEEVGFIEKYFGKFGKGLLKVINPMNWIRFLTADVSKK